MNTSANIRRHYSTAVPLSSGGPHYRSPPQYRGSSLQESPSVQGVFYVPCCYRVSLAQRLKSSECVRAGSDGGWDEPHVWFQVSGNQLQPTYIHDYEVEK